MSKLDKLASLLDIHMLEQGAQQQIYDALNLDFLIKLAIMPDCHTGYALPIGGVALLDNVISPGYVGYDIGCGMCCVITDEEVKWDEREKVKIFQDILNVVPTGKKSREKSIPYLQFKSASGDKAFTKVINETLGRQLGTLGSGNHFIELGENREGKLCITIHSGSRKSGWEIGAYYMDKAIMLEQQLPQGFLSLDGDLGSAYLEDLLFAQNYALANRQEMMEEVLNILRLPRSLTNNMINENHNHAIVTDDGVLHRKGATPAEEGQLGVIPGNMRDGVFITKGLGNKEYLSSASHGAGRKMSRSEAFKKVDFERFKEQMKGVVAKVNLRVLDEAPDAYKDINFVIDKQDGVVVDILDHITSLINVKSDDESPMQLRKRKKKKKKLIQRKAELFTSLKGQSSQDAINELNEIEQELEKMEDVG